MPQDTPSRKLDQYIVRFPEGMRDVLKYAAAENKRSMNAEIIERLDRSIMEDDARERAAASRVARVTMPADMSEDDFVNMVRAATDEAVRRAISEVVKLGGTIESLPSKDS